jgi:hypothetical protein
MSQNYYDNDNSVVGAYSLEAGDNLLADSKLTNHLTNYGGGVADEVNYYEKLASYFSENNKYLYRSNIDLSSTFPGKAGTGSQSFSVAFRLRLDEAGEGAYICGVHDFHQINIEGGPWFAQIQQGGDLIIKTRNDAGAYNYIGHYSLTLHRWYCIAFSYNAVAKQFILRVYDTVLQQEWLYDQTYANHYWINDSTVPFFIGGLPGAPSGSGEEFYCVRGQIDELIVWDSVIDIATFTKVCAFLYDTRSFEYTPSDNLAANLSENVSTFTGISFPVLPYAPDYPLQHQIVRELLNNDLGDGYCQTLSSESLFTRADGKGSVAAHYGLNKFNLQFRKRLSGSNNIANNLWKFFRDRLTGGNMPFYFYNPTEANFSIDLTGQSTTGRYLVRLQNPNQILNRDYFIYSLFNFGGIAVIEDRNAYWNRFALISAKINEALTFSDIITTPSSGFTFNVSDSLYWDYQDIINPLYMTLIEKRPSDNYGALKLLDNVNKMFRGKYFINASDNLSLNYQELFNVSVVGKLLYNNIEDILDDVIVDVVNIILMTPIPISLNDSLNVIYNDIINYTLVEALLYNAVDSLAAEYQDIISHVLSEILLHTLNDSFTDIYQDSLNSITLGILSYNTLNDSFDSIFDEYIYRGEIYTVFSDALVYSDAINIEKVDILMYNTLIDSLSYLDTLNKSLPSRLSYNNLSDSFSSIYNETIRQWDGSYNDTFVGVNNDIPNPVRWTITAGTPTIQSNALQLVVASGAPAAQDKVTSNATVTDDFDIQVDFSIVSGGAAAWAVDVGAIIDATHGMVVGAQGGDTNVYRQGYINGGSWTWATTARTGTTGKLRITRVTSTFHVYFWNGASWTEIGSGQSLGTGNVTVFLHADHWNTYPAFTWKAQNFKFNVGP